MDSFWTILWLFTGIHCVTRRAKQEVKSHHRRKWVAKNEKSSNILKSTLGLHFMSLVSVGFFATLIILESEVGKSGQKHLF